MNYRSYLPLTPRPFEFREIFCLVIGTRMAVFFSNKLESTCRHLSQDIIMAFGSVLVYIVLEKVKVIYKGKFIKNLVKAVYFYNFEY